MGRRGLISELNRMAKAAARETERQQRVAVREHNAAIRKAEQARKAEERARKRASQAFAAERKRMEKEAKEAHIAAMQAEVDARNSALAEIYDSIDNLLAATLDVDDYVDLDQLRRKVKHPQFNRPNLESPIPPPSPIPRPPEPKFITPSPPKGFFGRKKKHANAIAEAEIAHAQAQKAWRAKIESIEAKEIHAAAAHAQAERKREAALKHERDHYAAECEARSAEIEAHNARIDELKNNLSYGTTDAVQEYVEIVLDNSVYPPHFSVSHEAQFDPTTAELTMRVLVPPPMKIPDIKTYKYTKSTDEITAAKFSKKACADRYSGAINQVALRSIHEVFEADRRGVIQTIALEVGTMTTVPATGRTDYIPFIAVAAERETFIDFDLSSVVPTATLEHLGAAVSKKPYDLVAADTTGVRSS